MDKNNIGFRQYKLSEDFTMNIALGHTIENHGFVVDEDYPLSNAVDGNEDTYCKLTNVIFLPSYYLILDFQKLIHFNKVKIVFNNSIKQIRLLDENDIVFCEEGSASSAGFSIIEKSLDKKMSKIKFMFRGVYQNVGIKISSIELYSDNTIIPSPGYYIKDFEIQSEKIKGGEDNGDN